MPTKEYRRAYRLKNRDKILENERRYYHEVRKHQPRPSRRKNQTTRCQACDILMVSKFARNGRILCEGCRSSPRIKRLRATAWAMRYWYKKQGRTVPKRYVDLTYG